MWFLLYVFALGTTVNGAINMPCPRACPARAVQYTCTITGGNTAGWIVRDTSGTQLGGLQSLVGGLDLVGDQQQVGTSPFSAAIDSYIAVSVELNTTISYNGTMDVTGYQVQCGDGGSDPAICTVDKQGIPLAPTNLVLSSFANDSVSLTFDPPDNNCVVSYTISLNGNTPTPTTDTLVTLSKPSGDPVFTTYNVSIEAVDTGGRTSSSPGFIDCFLFSGPQAVSLNFGPQYQSDDNCSDGTTNASLSWTPMSCLPDTDSYTINHNGSALSPVVESDPSFTVINATLGEIYFVEITPNNVIGPGEPTTTVFSVPSDCPTVTSPTASLTPFMSPSPDTRGQSLGVIIGIAVAATIVIAIIVILILVILIVVAKKKFGSNKTSPPNSGNPKKGISYHRHDYENANEMVQTNGTNSDSPQGAVYADISHDKKKSAKPAPKNNEQVTYSDINHPPPTEYADLEHGRGTGGKIPKKSGVVYSAVSQQ